MPLWWRFSRYEVANGVVRPTADATAEEYDPWQVYLDSRQRHASRIRVSPPYQDLLELWAEIRPRDTDGTFSRLDLRQEKRLLWWCRRNGLLGLWHHEVMLALFPEEEDDAATCMRGYERIPWGWRECRVGHTRSRRSRGQGGLRAPEELTATWPREVWRDALPSGGFVLRELGFGSVTGAPLEPTWKLYFEPDGPLGRPVWPIPSPAGPDFWRWYGEPVSRIMFAAQELTLGIEDLAKTPGDERRRAARGHLNALAAPAAPAIVDAGEGYSPAWDYPSLLAGLALMAITDASGGARPRRCGACGVPFLTRAYQARYCSSRCKETARSRRRRATESTRRT